MPSFSRTSISQSISKNEISNKKEEKKLCLSRHK
jgi:hypothetical protein